MDETLKVIRVPDNLSLTELAEFLNKFPEGDYKFMIYEFDEEGNIEG